MLEKLDRERVAGFLKARGQRIVNGKGEEVLLNGWGLGNWMLCEGYMWMARDNRNFDRPRNIEDTIRDLTGTEYAGRFWRQFRENYITKDDIKRMAELGYNSLRIPFNWRLFMEDEPGEIKFREEGFTLIDRCLSWCEEYKIYAFLDLHGAPGGQTGDNIDDSRDNMPRLFMDRDYWDKGIALWRELARRYRDRWIVGGYDLLNEPIRTVRYDYPNVDHYVPKLAQFYREVTAAIREIDKDHLLSIEGHHWSTEPLIFWKKYDDNMVVHFHRYGCPPDLAAYETFTKLRNSLDVPLWLGETGENNNPWYAAMYTLAFKLDIGINVWPWKKMECLNSPYSVKQPENWDRLLNYTTGGPKPGKKEAAAMLDEYLANMKIENCRENREVTAALFRRPPVTLRGSDFDPLPGKGQSYSGLREETNFFYRHGTGMAVVPEQGHDATEDTGWARWGIYAVELGAGEFVVYTIHRPREGTMLKLSLNAQAPASLKVEQDGCLLGSVTVSPAAPPGCSPAPEFKLHAGTESLIKITAESGPLVLNALMFEG
ncbi:MAG: cellulase family glycosylhydrolase [Treponema sp.]|jgi:hypothetical protein|nr:cellulase family glycosylhydrolase [Treponema sp.]